MTVTPDYVRKIFKGLENGDGTAVFAHVADDIDWTVMGTHPLAGRYRSKADFIAGTFTKLGHVLPQGAQLRLEYLIVKGDQAVVELHSLATARNGMRFDNRHCWILFFEAGRIVLRPSLSRLGPGHPTFQRESGRRVVRPARKLASVAPLRRCGQGQR
jgi:uncharacterized protein